MHTHAITRMTPNELYALEADICASPDAFPILFGEEVIRALDAHETLHSRLS